MMNPEMMQAAQKMMANMKPEDMQRMSQMAASMDPKVMESMMQNMGGPGMKVDAAQAVEQMKSMTPEQMKTGLAQAQGQMSAQKQYMYNAAEMLKNQGNAEVKQENFDEALAKYTKALENLSGHAGDDVTNLQLNLLNNTALCYLKKKSFDKALESSERALKVDPRSFKALFRRGQAKEGMGSLAEGLYDVRRAAELSPNDKAIAKELERLRAELKERGIPEEAAVNTEKHEVSAAWQSASSGSTPTTFSPPQSRSPGAVNDPGLSDQLAKAAEKIAENPDMLTQATEAMSKLTPEQMQSMMGALPPGVDAETMKSQMESLQKNPDMLKNAMESLKAIPPEERKKLLAQRYDAASGPPAGVDQAAMAKMFEGGGSEGDMMRKAAEQMSANPELTKQMSEMMMNMPPEQMQSMMEMSARMRGGAGGGGSGSASSSMPAPGAGGMDPMSLMSDPGMMKATEELMKNMSPEMLTSMARSTGMDISEDKAKVVARFLPWALKAMRLFGHVKKVWSAMWSTKGRIVLAAVVLLIAVGQHYRSG